MNENYAYLKDLPFLKSLIVQPIQSIFVRFTSLDWNENPLCEIQGLATSGSMNLNGQSSIRRTCNLTITIPDETDYQINSQYTIKQLIGVDNKINLEIGYENTTGQYEEYSILWFPLGMFVITQSSYSHSLSGLNVSLQLQDKMCLLNGTCGGSLPAEINFSKVDELSPDGKYGTKSLTLYQIIQEAVNHWGGEPLEKIIISDIPEKIQKLVVWNPSVDLETKEKPTLRLFFSNEWYEGRTTLPNWSTPDTDPKAEEYDLKNVNSHLNFVCITLGGGKYTGKTIYVNQTYAKARLASWFAPNPIPKEWWKEGEEFVADNPLKNLFMYYRTHSIEIDPLAPAGSQYVDFIYSDDLVVKAGGNLCEVLDKIKNYLGNFEYFYKDNIFYFQERKNYLNTRKTSIDVEKYKELQQSIYDRTGSSLPDDSGDIPSGGDESTLYNPDLMSGMPLDIINFNSADYFLQNVNENSLLSFDNSQIITSYSNTPQYSKIKNDFIVWGVRKNASGKANPLRYHLVFDKKPQVGNTYEVAFMFDEAGIEDGEIVYSNLIKMPYKYSSLSAFPKTGITGLIYYARDTGKYYVWDASLDAPIYVEEKVNIKQITTTDWRDELYLSGMRAEVEGGIPNDYYAELKEEWPKIYDTENGHFREEFLLNPGDFNYFLDFIDTNGLAYDISVSKIGRRIKVEDSDKVNCLFEPIYPNFTYVNKTEYDALDELGQKNLIRELEDAGLNYLIVPEDAYTQLSSATTSTNSAYYEARDLMMEHSGFNENITLQCLPMYFIEPNTRITVNDEASEINGDYNINSISLPLTAGGTMNISASKIVDRL